VSALAAFRPESSSDAAVDQRQPERAIGRVVAGNELVFAVEQVVDAGVEPPRVREPPRAADVREHVRRQLAVEVLARAGVDAFDPVILGEVEVAALLGVGIVTEDRDDHVGLVENHEPAVQIGDGHVVALHRR